MDYNKRQELFIKYQEYFLILDLLGKGIMIKPHLWEYISRVKKISKSTFERDLKKLEAENMLEIARTSTATIIGSTGPALMLLRNKKYIKEVSTTSIWTNRNLKMSTVKNEYVLNNILSDGCSLEDLKGSIAATNLLSKTGDNTHVLSYIRERHLKETNLKEHNMEKIDKEIKKIGDLAYNRALQLKKNDLDEEGKKIPKVKRVVSDDSTTLNNLQARHIYFKDMGKFNCRYNPGGEITYSAPITFTYIEITDLLGYQKFKNDMDTLSAWLEGIGVSFGKVIIEVVVEPNRRSAIEDTIKEWKRKRLSQFSTGDVAFNIVEVDVRNKYLKGLNISVG